MPTLRRSETWADVIPDPLPAGIGLDARKDVKARLKPGGEAMRNFDRLMPGVLCWEHAILFLCSALDGSIAVQLEHSLAGCNGLGPIDLNLEVPLSHNTTRPAPAHSQQHCSDVGPLHDGHR